MILSAGAIGSPQILMLSGIGDPGELRAAGVEPRHELPGVGRNLQDHPFLTMLWELSEGPTPATAPTSRGTCSSGCCAAAGR